jgi:hypothetical protein
MNPPFYKNWDPRTRNLYTEHAFRPLPTKHRSSKENGTEAVMTKSTKAQEILSFARAAYPPNRRDIPLHEWQPDSSTHPDLQNSYRDKSNAFYRPESLITFAQLPHLRPSILYIHGSRSPMSSSSPPGRQNLFSSTGTGNVGVAAGKVDEAIVPGGGHLVVMKQPTWMVEDVVGPRISEEMRRWGETERRELEEWETWEEHEKS